MKMIIVEGHDNSGKSTLAQEIGAFFDFDVKESEGPPKSADEINERCARYADMAKDQPVLLVRHPVISNAIYAKFREEGDPITDDTRAQFYSNPDVLIIYADQGNRGLTGHKLKSHDTPEHMALVEANDATILQLYREWAIAKAHVLYRIGDGYTRVFQAVEAFLHSSLNDQLINNSLVNTPKSYGHGPHGKY